MNKFLAAILFVACSGCMIAGWVLNIYKLFQADTLHGMEIARAIGVFIAPLGSILGWC